MVLGAWPRWPCAMSGCGSVVHARPPGPHVFPAEALATCSPTPTLPPPLWSWDSQALAPTGPSRKLGFCGLSGMGQPLGAQALFVSAHPSAALTPGRWQHPHLSPSYLLAQLGHSKGRLTDATLVGRGGLWAPPCSLLPAAHRSASRVSYPRPLSPCERAARIWNVLRFIIPCGLL